MKQEIENVELTYLSIDDYQELKAAMIESYSNMPNSYWNEPQIKKLISFFPEGQVVIKVNNQIAGCALSIIVDYDKFGDQHTLSLIHISEPTRLGMISYAVFCLKKKKTPTQYVNLKLHDRQLHDKTVSNSDKD